MMIHRLAAGVLCALLALPAAASGTPAAVAADYHANAARLAPHLVDGAWLDADPAAPGLLERQWELAGRWVAAWLDAHPGAAAESLEQAFAAMAGDGAEHPLQALLLDADSWLVAIAGPPGNVFIVDRHDGRFRVAWNIANAPRSVAGEAHVIGPWRARSAQQAAAPAADAGPVAPQVGRLPGDARGRARFWIDAARAQAAGSTVAAQVSIWQWDGARARLLLAHPYAQWLARERGTRFVDGQLLVRGKGELRAFSTCSACIGLELDWRVRVDAAGLKVLGDMPVERGLVQVDALFARRLQGRAAGSLADPAAIRAADAIIARVRGERSPEEWRQSASLGMLGDVRNTVWPGGVELCLATEVGGAHRFTLRERAGRLRVTGVAAVAGGCAAGDAP